MNDFIGKRLEGMWRLKGSPKRNFEGELRIDERHHGTLVLKGKARHLAAIPERAAVFLGNLSGQYRYAISLLDAGLSSGPSVQGDGNNISQAEFFTNFIIVGAHLRSVTRPVALGARCRLTGLRQWCDDSGFAGALTGSRETAGGRMTLTHEEAASPFHSIGPGKQLRLLRRYSGPLFFAGARKELRLEEVDEIEFKFLKPQSLKQVLAEMLVWQSFLTFALRRPSFILELRVRLADDGPHSFSRMVMVPGSKSEADVGTRRALFLRSTWGDARIRPWANAFKRLEKAVLLVSGASYQEDAFLHTRLLAYLQALEVYHREAFPEEATFADDDTRKRTIKKLRSAIPKELDQGVRKKISERLSFVGELSLLERLQRLLAQHRQSVGPLFPDEKDMALLRDVRNFLTHYGDKKSIDRDFLTSRRLLILCEKTRLFVEACLLSAIGLQDAEIAGVLSAGESYHYWRRQQH